MITPDNFKFVVALGLFFIGCFTILTLKYKLINTLGDNWAEKNHAREALVKSFNFNATQAFLINAILVILFLGTIMTYESCNNEDIRVAKQQLHDCRSNSNALKKEVKRQVIEDLLKNYKQSTNIPSQ